MKKSLEGYHSNKNTKAKAYILKADGSFATESIKEGKVYYGMELEMEFGREKRDSILQTDIPQAYYDMLHFETDGSLNYGIEVITEPMTLEAMVKFLNLPFLKGIIGASTPQSNSGVHIHVSKIDDDVTTNMQIILAKLGTPLQNATRTSSYGEFYHRNISTNVTDVLRPSMEGATVPQALGLGFLLNRYFLSKGLGGSSNARQRYFGPQLSQAIESLDYRSSERYNCLNTQNSYTNEFRFFNSTDDVSRLEHYLTLVESIVTMAQDKTNYQLVAGLLSFDSDNWTVKWVNSDNAYKIQLPTAVSNIVNLTEDVHKNLVFWFDRMIERQRSDDYKIGDVVAIDKDFIDDTTDIFSLGYSEDMKNIQYGVITAIIPKGNRFVKHEAVNFKNISPLETNIYVVKKADGTSEAEYGFPAYWFKNKVSITMSEARTLTVTVDGIKEA